LLERISRFVVTNPELPSNLAGDKAIRLDLRVSLSDGRRVDVEMQVRSTPELPARLVYYAARDYGTQLPRGADYTELTPTIVVVWLGDSLWSSPRAGMGSAVFAGGKAAETGKRTPNSHSNESSLLRIFELRERHTGEQFSDQLQFRVIQLRDANHPGKPSNEELALVRWTRFLAVTNRSDLDELALEDATMNKAAATLERLSLDPETARLAQDREDAIQMYQYSLHAAQRRGQVEGRTEGRQEGRAEALAEAVILTLKKRRIALTDAELLLIGETRDLTLLHVWQERAFEVRTVAELLL
jgi:predicted transposase/invertase (TIGR01784 family)